MFKLSQNLLLVDIKKSQGWGNCLFSSLEKGGESPEVVPEGMVTATIKPHIKESYPCEVESPVWLFSYICGISTTEG